VQYVGSKKLTVSLATTSDDIDEWLDTNAVSSSKSTKKNHLNRLSIGLDIEWRPNYQVSFTQSISLPITVLTSYSQAGSKPNKTALIQLSTSSSCLLIPTHYFKVANSNNEFKFSDKFKKFLANADVLKVLTLLLTLLLTLSLNHYAIITHSFIFFLLTHSLLYLLTSLLP
jgi:hypothetical protein